MNSLLIVNAVSVGVKCSHMQVQLHEQQQYTLVSVFCFAPLLKHFRKWNKFCTWYTVTYVCSMCSLL